MNDIYHIDNVYPTIATYIDETIIIDCEICTDSEVPVCINIMSDPDNIDTIILIEDVIRERTNCCVYIIHLLYRFFYGIQII